MAPLSKHGWADLLTPGFRDIFNRAIAEYVETNDMIPQLFQVMTSDRAEEKFSEVGAMGDMKRLEATGRVEYDTFAQGYDVTIDLPEYTKGFFVSRKEMDDELYNVINQKPADLALAATRTQQFYAASVFNHAFDTSWTDPSGITLKCTGGDSAALCSDSHTFATGLTASTTPATVVDNKGTSALSATSIAATRLLMRKFKDDRGNLLNVRPDTIIIPPDLEKTAEEILNSTNVSGEISNTVNALRGKLKVVVWDLLTDAESWFMVDSALMKRCLLWINRVPLEIDRADDFDSVAAKWRAYARWGIGFRGWQWIYGHTV